MRHVAGPFRRFGTFVSRESGASAHLRVVHGGSAVVDLRVSVYDKVPRDGESHKNEVFFSMNARLCRNVHVLEYSLTIFLFVPI